MARYRRNPLREERINRLGQTADLPLFGAGKAAVSLAEALPKAIPIATETKRLSRMIQRHDPYHLGEDQQKVFDLMLENGPMTNKEMGAILGWDASTVSARNYELRQYGLVVDDIKRQCRITGNVVQAWRVK